MARLSEHGIRLSSMSPSFLNSNSTSHTWPFSAVAELIDNASDPGVSAKQICIDVVEENGHLCLTFTDNGCGMTPNKLHKMLSFGFTEKGSAKFSQQAIGVYGNGFKSGSMRLGRDALIFTKNGGCQTVGMLSQTFLENIKAQAVIVPIVPFNQQTNSIVMTEDSEASLSAILQNSIITSVEQIHAHFNSIPTKKGTKILIWNIRRTKDGKPEIDFETDVTDFRLPSIQIEELRKGLRSSGSLRAEQNIPEMQCSLRAYLSILYLKPRTQIILRGKKNISKLLSKRLKHIEHDVYKPQFSKEKVKVTFGLSPEKKDLYGIMMYHKNRLIKAYEKVGCQLKASGQRAGVGVIGIIECNFLKPAHNKQDFEYTKEYRLTISALGIKLNDYWKEVTEKQARERDFHALDRYESEEESANNEAPMWLQCEECLKWRSVPQNHYNDIPDSWNCSQNPNPRYRNCSAPEEAEHNEDLLTASYQKNHKKEECPKSKNRGKSLEVHEKMWVSQDVVAKQQILSSSSSELVQPVQKADRCHTEENTTEQDEAATDHVGDHYADRQRERETDIKDKTPEENETDDQTLETKEGDMKKETNKEAMEIEKENTDTSSYKRKSGSVFHCAKKRSCLWNKPQPENMKEEMNPEKQTNIPETLTSNKTKQDRSGRVEKPGDMPTRIFTNHSWTHSLPSTQTVVVSPLSRTEGPRSRPAPPEEGDQVSNEQKLIGLQKEVQRLRQLLGLEVTKVNQGTMTTADISSEKPKEGLLTPASSAGSREVGCQTDVAEQSSTSSQAPGPQGVVNLGQRSVWGLEEQPEQSRPRKKTETQTRMKAGDREAYEDSRSSQESLRGIRNNVVVLLTALLPQLDLANISLETTDVDNILQQIIEVNSLKI